MTPSDPNGFSEPREHSLLVLYSNFIGVKWEKEALVPRVHEGNTGSTSGSEVVLPLASTYRQDPL